MRLGYVRAGIVLSLVETVDALHYGPQTLGVESVFANVRIHPPRAKWSEQ